jgi:hypothetical protein
VQVLGGASWWRPQAEGNCTCREAVWGGLTPLRTLLVNLDKRLGPIHGIYTAYDKREKPLWNGIIALTSRSVY